MMRGMASSDPLHVLRVDPSARVLTGQDHVDYWRRLFMPPEQRLDETAGERRRVAWRILRELGRLRGLIRVGEPLADATAIHPSPWTEPWQVFQVKGVDTRDPLVLSFGRLPFPLLPTACEPAASDEDMERFGEIAHEVALRLGIHRQPAAAGALDLLDDQDVIRRAWPRVDEILEVEALEQKRVLKMILARPEIEVCSSLGQEGYRDHEVMDLLALARTAAKKRISADPAADRAMMILKLQEEISLEDKATAKAALLRLLASVQGLLQSGENAFQDKDVGEMVRDVISLPAGDQPRGLLEAPVESSHEPEA